MLLSLKPSFCLLLILFSLFLAGTGCNDGTTEPQGEDVLVPLDVGNMWIGEESASAWNGVNGYTRFDTLKIISSRSFNGEVWYRTNRTEGDQELWYTNRADGLHGAYLSPDDTNSLIESRILFRKYPARVGDTTHYHAGQIFFDSTGRPIPHAIGMQVESIDELIQTAIGGFITYLYRMRVFEPAGAEMPGLTPSEHYIAGIGPARITWYHYKSSGEALVIKRWELVTARLKSYR